MATTTYTHKGVTYHKETKEVLTCLFCRIQRRVEPGTIDYEDENYVVFRTTGPVSSYHVLVTPRQHIQNLRSVSKDLDGAKFLYSLKQIGMKTIAKQFNDDPMIIQQAKYSFHIPPYNSIDHLHLHVIAFPEKMSFIDSFKYPPSDRFYCMNVDSLIQQYSNEFYQTLIETGKLFDRNYIYEE